MPHLVKIGNSRGIRIPKSLIQQAGLEAAELEFQLVDGGLLIKPVKKHPRQGWDKEIREAIAKYGDEPVDNEWLDAPLTDDAEWEW